MCTNLLKLYTDENYIQMKKIILPAALLLFVGHVFGQTLSETQMRNARATGYAIVAARNPGQKFAIYMIPWDGVNTLEQNANTQINTGWHAQAAIKGNYFYQDFNGSDFSVYSSVLLSQQDFDSYKNTGTQWWIVCSTLPPFSGPVSTFNGNVGIGALNPDYRLTVNGKIKAEEVQVVVDVPADYVFEKDYSLMPLPEVEKFVTENKHLPGMPNAQSLITNGWQVGEMNNKLLEKVEELTLYLIEMKKENEAIKQELNALKANLKKK